MTITREQVADLQPGDVVEVVHEDWPEGTVVRGPLWLDSETLQVGRVIIRHWDGRHPHDTGLALTVVSRAARPLYVNHPRTGPSCGDVFQPEHSQWPLWVAGHDRIAEHKSAESCRWIGRADLPQGLRLRLLVDGETGMTVPS